MLHVKLYENSGIVTLEPDGRLSEDDFRNAAAVIDPYIEKSGGIKGVIIHVKSFPGWDSFGALIKHLEFVKEHHKYISRVAFVTNSPIGNFAESVASHFVKAEVKNFPFESMEEAKEWIADNKDK